MIKIENVSIAGFEAAIRAMRNPKNSWEKSDSHIGLQGSKWKYDPGYIIGPNDKELMIKLAKGGSTHAKYRRQIVVWCDITMPSFVWAEFDTYKVGTVRNSCSFMHKGTAKAFEIVDFSFEADMIEKTFSDVCSDGDEALYEEGKYNFAVNTVLEELNRLRDLYLKTKDDRVFQLIRRLLPSGYNIKATITFNYEVISAMYRDRKHHRLIEWREFCDWTESLPYSWIFTGDVGEEREHTPLAEKYKGDLSVFAPLFEPDPEPLPAWPKTNPVFGLSDETKYFGCYVTKEVIPYDRSKTIVGWDKGSLWFEGEKVGDMIALEDIVAEGMVNLVYALKNGHEYLSGCRIQQFNFGFTVNPEEDELQLMLWRKE